MEKVTLEQAIAKEQSKLSKEEVINHMEKTVNENKENKIDIREVIQQLSMNNEFFIQSNRVEMINLEMDTKVIQNLDAKLSLGKKLIDYGYDSTMGQVIDEGAVEQGGLLIGDVVKSLSDMREEMAKQLNNKSAK